MAAFREGKIVRVERSRSGLFDTSVALESGEIAAVGFPDMLGPLGVGDRVIVNTTGIELGLGTGGIGFIVWNLDAGTPPVELGGHIVKLRYTPWQREVLSAEEHDSPHHEALADITSIDGLPVVACSLHSQVAGVTAGIKAARPDARVGYLMTDGASLPLAWSDLVADLVAARLLDVSCTCGHAFGGDFEAVNVFSGLATLKVAAGADVVVVAMGPGVVGTGTALGHTALEQGQILDATEALGGTPIACLRIAFADERPRHQGVSHHTLTALTLVAHCTATVVVPNLPGDEADRVHEQLRRSGVAARHRVVDLDGSSGIELLEAKGLAPTSMGRAFDEVRELFGAASAAGRAAAELL